MSMDHESMNYRIEQVITSGRESVQAAHAAIQAAIEAGRALREIKTLAGAKWPTVRDSIHPDLRALEYGLARLAGIADRDPARLSDPRRFACLCRFAGVLPHASSKEDGVRKSSVGGV